MLLRRRQKNKNLLYDFLLPSRKFIICVELYNYRTEAGSVNMAACKVKKRG